MWSVLLLATATAAEPSPELRLYCALDDKYATLSEAERATWSGKVFSGTEQPRDLFTSGGGGPLGAEWNTACDMLLHVTGSTTPTLTLSPAATVPLKPVPDHPGDWYAWLPASTWEQAPIPIPAAPRKDLEKAHPADAIDATKCMEFRLSQPGQPTQTAVVLVARGE
jgi:hypothetical protein